MASLKFMLGLIPSTSKIEQTEKELTNEFEKLKQIAVSDKLAKYTKLKETVESSGFMQKKKEISSENVKANRGFSPLSLKNNSIESAIAWANLSSNGFLNPNKSSIRRKPRPSILTAKGGKTLKQEYISLSFISLSEKSSFKIYYGSSFSGVIS